MFLSDQAQKKDICATDKQREGHCETAIPRHDAENTCKVRLCTVEKKG